MADVRHRYRERIAEHGRELEELDARDRRLSSARGVAFLATAGAALFGLFEPLGAVWIAAGVTGAAFVALVVAHALVSTRQFDLRRRVTLLERGLGRAEGSYRSQPGEGHVRGDGLVDPSHPYAVDLDLFGVGSLFEQLNSTQTAGGAARLAEWLLHEADTEVIARRQGAARELCRREELREELALIALRAGTVHQDTRELCEWAGSPGWPGRRVAVAGTGLLLCCQLGAAVAAFGFGIGVATKLWLGLVALQVVVLGPLRPRLEEVIGRVSGKQSPLGSFHELLQAVEAAGLEDPHLAAQQARVRGAAATMRRLDALVGMASVRHNGFAHLLANVFLMWDVWCAWRLDQWRAAHGAAVAGWLDALAEVEALGAIGTFAAEHPSFAWPEVDDGPTRLSASGLGHPLIVADRRVENDVELGDPVRALMITGSNMSGKSTMLRSLGVATVLAQAGAPVCARSLSLSRVRLGTSVRVDDSLLEGASRFYAEVRALKRIVDSLAQEGPPVMFLLDEVLHGTNSRERVIGAKAVVAHMVARGAIGAVTSHDLGLVELEAETAGRVRNVHFEDHLVESAEGEQKMAFDYTMKPGPVGTSNALRLMRQVGIDIVPEG